MNILEELWYGNIYPNEQAIKQNRMPSSWALDWQPKSSWMG